MDKEIDVISHNLVKSALESLSEITQLMAENNRELFIQFAENTQLLMRCYEMLFIGRTDVSRDELRAILLDRLMSCLSKEKFSTWTGFAGHDADHRNWDFLFTVNGVPITRSQNIGDDIDESQIT